MTVVVDTSAKASVWQQRKSIWQKSQSTHKPTQKTKPHSKLSYKTRTSLKKNFKFFKAFPTKHKPSFKKIPQKHKKSPKNSSNHTQNFLPKSPKIQLSPNFHQLFSTLLQNTNPTQKIPPKTQKIPQNPPKKFKFLKFFPKNFSNLEQLLLVSCKTIF